MLVDLTLIHGPASRCGRRLTVEETRRRGGGGVAAGAYILRPVRELVELEVGARPRVDGQLQYQQARHVHHHTGFHLHAKVRSAQLRQTRHNSLHRTQYYRVGQKTGPQTHDHNSVKS